MVQFDSSDSIHPKINLPSLRNVLELINQIDKEKTGFSKDIKTNPQIIREIWDENFSWSSAYETSLQKHLYSCIEKIKDIAPIKKVLPNHEVPLARASEIVKIAESIDVELFLDNKRKLKNVFALLMPTIKTIESIQIHGQSLNALVGKMRSGKDGALFEVIQIDRSAMNCRPIADRIARAEIEQDDQFFSQLRKAMVGPSKKKFKSYYKIRILLELLDEDGTLDALSTNQRYRLFCEELGLYSLKHTDPARSLSKLIWRWKKDR